MQAELIEQISEVVTDVLSKQIYAFVENWDKAPDFVADETFLRVDMDLVGEGRCWIAVSAPAATAQVIAGNMLGWDESAGPIPANQAEDAVSEMLNVLGGHIRNLLVDAEQELSPTLPTRRQIDKSDWDSLLADSCAIGFLVDDCPMLLILESERGA